MRLFQQKIIEYSNIAIKNYIYPLHTPTLNTDNNEKKKKKLKSSKELELIYNN